MDRIPVILDCDPGIDDAVALLLGDREPGARPARRDHGRRQRRPRADDAERAARAGARRRSGHPGRGRLRPPARAALRTAAEVHGVHGLGRVELPAPATPAVEAHAVELMAEVVTARTGR